MNELGPVTARARKVDGKFTHTWWIGGWADLVDMHDPTKREEILTQCDVNSAVHCTGYRSAQVADGLPWTVTFTVTAMEYGTRKTVSQAASHAWTDR